MILWTSQASHTYILLILIFCSYENRRFVDFLAHFFKKNHCFGEGAERATSNRNSDEFSSDTPLFLKGDTPLDSGHPIFWVRPPTKIKNPPQKLLFWSGFIFYQFLRGNTNKHGYFDRIIVLIFCCNGGLRSCSSVFPYFTPPELKKIATSDSFPRWRFFVVWAFRWIYGYSLSLWGNRWRYGV